jgi:dihydroorotate dehydrogenase electron transfer subunit
MPIDVAAAVVANRALSPDYNVLTLAAPAIAAAAAPGQFVMIKTGSRRDPLLRRPFSVFEITRDSRGTPTAITILSKRIGISTRELYEAQPGQTIACLGPLGRPFAVVDPPADAWMVAGGVGLAPFATLAEALAAKQVRSTLFYGARSGAELFHLDFIRALDRRLDGRPSTSPVMLYACGPERMLAATANIAAAHGRPCQVSVERIMGCGLGGCYSCVVPMRGEDGRFHHVRSCLAGPVLVADQVRWD